MSEPKYQEVRHQVMKLLHNLNEAQEAAAWLAIYLKGRHRMGDWFHQVDTILRAVRNRLRSFTESNKTLLH